MKFLLLAGIHSALTPSSEDWMWGTSGRFGCFLTGGLRWPSGAAEEARVSNSAVCFNPKLIQLLRREKSRDGRTSWQRQMELDAVLSVNTAPTLPLEVSTARGWSLFCSSSEGRLSYLSDACCTTSNEVPSRPDHVNSLVLRWPFPVYHQIKKL